MALRVGKVEFKATQRAEALEQRSLVALQVPGAAGSVHQDLGRAPVLLIVEGLLYGEGSSGDVEALRGAFSSGEPQSFAADVVVGTEITDVIIEDLRVHQVAGTRDRYQASLRLREHTEPPEPLDVGVKGALGLKGALDLKGVLDDILSHADEFMALAQAAMRVYQDPSCLLDELAKNPALRDLLGADELERLARQALEDTLGMSPEEVAQLVKDAGEAADVVMALVEDGPSLLEDLLAVGSSATALVGTFTDGSLLDALNGEGSSALDRVIQDLSKLVASLERLLKHRALELFVKTVARKLGLEKLWNEAVLKVGEQLQTLSQAVLSLIPVLRQIQGLLALAELLVPALGGMSKVVGAFSGQLADIGVPVPSQDIQSVTDELQPTLDRGLGYGKALLPTPPALQELASRLSPKLRDALLRYQVVPA